MMSKVGYTMITTKFDGKVESVIMNDGTDIGLLKGFKMMLGTEWEQSDLIATLDSALAEMENRDDI